MALVRGFLVAFVAAVASGTAIPRNSITGRDVSDCPGYTASNVEVSSSGLTADLSLAGEACNVYGEDLEDLILEVTYETSESMGAINQGRKRRCLLTS